MAVTVMLILKLLLLLIFATWVTLWILKPTEFWTRKWKEAEEKATTTFFSYYGLDFVVYTFPLIALAITGFIYLELKQRQQRSSQRRNAITTFSNPLVINQFVGILSGIQILASSIFIAFVFWTFFTRVSNDFKKMTPVKSFKLSLWQYKVFRMVTRCGLLAEACLALLLLPILRAMSVFRIVGVQFETSVRYHIWLGTAMICFATLHGAGTFFIWGINHRLQDEMWKWQKKGRIYLAGEIALATGVIIWITSLPQVRRKWFEVFYYTHHLYIVFLVFFLFHGGDRHFYMVFPGIFLFALDRLLRFVQSMPESCILSARVYPCRAIELYMPKDPSLKYTPSSVIFLKVPSISKFQWHPFTLSSSSSIDEHTMSVIIRSEGHWTNSLYTKVVSETDAENNQNRCIPIAIEGPYGPASLDFLRYENLFLVAGGIGITPFLSILQEVSSILRNGKNIYPHKVQLVYAIKKSQEICLLKPILPQLLATEKFHIKLKLFVTQENQIGTTLREVLNDIPEIQTTTFSTKCAAYATHGTESLLWMASLTMVSSLVFLIALISLNHYFLTPTKKASEQKHASSLIDLLVMCSFSIAMISITSVAVVIRWKRLRKGIQLFSDTQSLKQISIESGRELDKHEIHFGERPNIQGILSNFANECGGSADMGVLVCGPETMKESVASECRLVSQGNNAKEKKSHLSFHSLNFTI